MGERSRRAMSSGTAPTQQVPPSTLAALLRISDDGQFTIPRAGQQAPEGQVAEHEVPESEKPPIAQRQRATPAPVPPWFKVIATTLRLWLQRRGGRAPGVSGRQHRGISPTALAVVAVALVLFTAGGVTIAMLRPTGHAAPGSRQHASQGPAAVPGTAATPGRQAAGWVAEQVSRNAIVACDPGLCRQLQAHGFPAQNLLTLRSNATDPLGSDVIVATAAVRSGLGSRLRLVYAPTVIASFGSGAERVDILAVAPDGAPAYQSALTADRAARRNAGAQLARNPRIHTIAAVRQEFIAGRVDSRLLIALAALATWHSINVVAVGGAAPGASAAVPLRSMDISVPGGAGAVAAIRSFLLAQRAPYLPSQVSLVRLAGGTALRVGFGAPSPLGLLSNPVTR